MHTLSFPTYADLWRPRTKLGEHLYDVLLVLGGSWLIAMCAQIIIPLPHTPVPVTAQSFAVLMIGVLLGSRRGALSAIAYLSQGALGLPFFAGARAGMGVLTGVTAGYLIGFVLAAYAVGWLAERGMDRQIFPAVLAMLFGTAVILACGVTWLSTLVGFSKALTLGVFPFLPGAIIKLLAAALLLPLGWSILGSPSQHH